MFCALLLCMVAGCGDALRGEEEGGDAVVSGSGCEALGAQLCERRRACETYVLRDTGREFASEAECAQRFALACESWLALPDTRLTASAVEACAGELATASCAEVHAAFYPRTTSVPHCLQLQGMRADDAACAHGLQCASSHCDFARGTGTCGVCKPGYAWWSEVAYEGDACGEPTPRCALDLTCSDEGLCAHATVCDPLVSDCRPTIEVAIGGSCGDVHSETFRECPAGSQCVSQNDFGSGTCIGYASDGAACDTWEGPPCLFPARCIDSVCHLPDALCQ